MNDCSYIHTYDNTISFRSQYHKKNRCSKLDVGILKITKKKRKLSKFVNCCIINLTTKIYTDLDTSSKPKGFKELFSQ